MIDENHRLCVPLSQMPSRRSPGDHLAFLRDMRSRANPKHRPAIDKEIVRTHALIELRDMIALQGVVS